MKFNPSNVCYLLGQKWKISFKIMLEAWAKTLGSHTCKLCGEGGGQFTFLTILIRHSLYWQQ